MAELLIRVKSKSNPDDIYKDCKLTKRGDVIVVQPDGWNWGLRELANPDWRILKLPGTDVSQFTDLLAPELDTDPTNPSKTLQRRAAKIDIDNLTIPLPMAKYLADDSRAQASFTVPPGLTIAAFRSLKAIKAAILDPAKIG